MSAELTRETLLCSPAGFGLSTITSVQRAACRIADGLPLGALAEDPTVVAMVGGHGALAALPTTAPIEVCNVASPRTAKSMIAAAGALRATQIVDVSGLAPGETARVSIVALTLDGARVVQNLIGGLLSRPALRSLVANSDRDSFLVKHPSAKVIEIKVTAGAPKGGNLVSRWCAGVIFDEAPRMLGEADGQINLDHEKASVVDRLLPGAQIQTIGSPWAPRGPVYDTVTSYFGYPTSDLVVLRITGPDANPAHWTPELCERLRRTNPVAWRIGVLGDFVDAESGMFSADAVEANTRATPLEIPPDACHALRVAAIDPSEAGSGNAFALVICDRDLAAKARVLVAREWRGCGPEAALKDIATICRDYGIRTAITDAHAPEALKAIARRFGLHLDVQRSTPATKVEQYSNLATLLATDAIELSPVPAIARDLLLVKKRASATDFTIELPRTADGRHCDYAPAIAAAIGAIWDPARIAAAEQRRQLRSPALQRRLALAGHGRSNTLAFEQMSQILNRGRYGFGGPFGGGF